MQFNLSSGADGAESITAIIDNEFFVAEKDHPNYPEIKAAVIARLSGSADLDDPSDAAIRDLFDLSYKLQDKFAGLSDRLRLTGGNVIFDGQPVDGTLTDTIMRFHDEKIEDWQPLILFFDKIRQNPNLHSQEYLYDWLRDNQFTISDDGDIIAYKSLRADFTSVHAGPAIVNGVPMNGNVPNLPGSVIQIPREQVAFDPTQTCSFGLHAATFRFAENFSRGPIVKLKINPKHVVSVPIDANGEKMRVEEYLVVEQVREALTTVVDYSGYSDMRYEDEEDYFEDEESEDEDDEPIEEESDKLTIFGAPLLTEADPELERLLAEEDEIERRQAQSVIEEARGVVGRLQNVLDRLRSKNDGE